MWRWVQENNTADMWKSWFDRDDTWHSLLTNVHNQVRTGYYQSCGHIMTPGMQPSAWGSKVGWVLQQQTTPPSNP